MDNIVIKVSLDPETHDTFIRECGRLGLAPEMMVVSLIEDFLRKELHLNSTIVMEEKAYSEEEKWLHHLFD